MPLTRSQQKGSGLEGMGGAWTRCRDLPRGPHEPCGPGGAGNGAGNGNGNGNGPAPLGGGRAPQAARSRPWWDGDGEDDGDGGDEGDGDGGGAGDGGGGAGDGVGGGDEDDGNGDEGGDGDEGGGGEGSLASCGFIHVLLPCPAWLDYQAMQKMPAMVMLAMPSSQSLVPAWKGAQAFAQKNV